MAAVSTISTSLAPHGREVVLPDDAPRVRVTAGPGSATQKTWNLRRPCTLIGSRRPAHILLHGRDMSAAHCVIVNTGREVLLKDLHTSAGTLCNSVRIGLTVLSDGDVITVGDTKIQVAIKAPNADADDSGCGEAYSDPTTFRNPISLSFVHAEKTWRIYDAVSLIGRHRSAFLQLDHEHISSRQAVLFRFDSDLAFFDLGGREGILLNGQPTSMAKLRRGDRIRLGPFSLCVGGGDAAGTPKSDAAASGMGSDEANSGQVASGRLDFDADRNGNGTGVLGKGDTSGDLAADAVAISSELDSLRLGITEAWHRLNIPTTEPTSADRESTPVDAEVEKELDSRDAALRGHLHELTVLQERLHDREHEVTALTVRLETEKARVAREQRAASRREKDLQKQTEDLSRREHVFAQRWAKMKQAKCPHCGESIGGPSNGTPPGS